MHRLEKTRAFLTEFIIVILFFTVSAVITVQLFAAASRKSTDSIDLTNGCIHAESMAEQIKSAIYADGMSGLDEYMLSQTGAGYLDEGMGTGCYVQYFDRDYEISDAENAYVTGYVRVLEERMDAGSMYNVTIEYKNDKKTVSGIDFSIYRGEAR